MPPRRILQVVARKRISPDELATPKSDWTSSDRVRQQIADAKRAIAALTPRQRDVLRGVLRGDSSKQIAHDLGISPRTVEIHRSSMLGRLGARTTADAVRIGIYAEMDSIDR